MTKVLVISGSSRKGALTPRFALEAYQIIEKNMEATYISLQDFNLPVYNGTKEQQMLENVTRLQQMAEEADGFFIVTPEYHNGISGALKNALDFLGKKHFINKPAAIAAVSGGGKGGINALNNLRLVLRGLQANVLPSQVITDEGDFDDALKLTNENARERLKALVDELNMYITLTQKMKADHRVKVN
ncbi:MAG: NAD(P)H-dependent oxidoreductase [Bacillaceae bacterium]|nr:NAD(P)H-dependent oxidoreductase [Bacillaceae bacterium]